MTPDGRDVVRLKKYGPCEGDSAHLTCEVDGDYSNWADSGTWDVGRRDSGASDDRASIRVVP
ncbi:hypothetical protein GT021_19125 [Streptomyces sp. SID5470]|uniref:hypothetical protein n=1 Tax=Streptomyces sp. CC0208 TaxID=2306165 RepID=UPI001319EC65|nr:hypothetical protein [Streptomyces sp. CC0208]MYT06539.1 hypothetical protein [Streptomyces sp. SID5470]